MPITGRANSTTYNLHKTGDIDVYQKAVPEALYITKQWAQGTGGFEWIVPETGWYYLKASFWGEKYAAGSMTSFQSFQLKKQSPGAITSDTIAMDTTFRYDQTNTLCLDKEVATIGYFTKGTKIFPRVWCGEEGKKFGTVLWVIKFGGGTVALLNSREGGHHGWRNREGECKTDYLGRTGASGNHQSQTRLGEPGWNLHSELPVVRIVRTDSGYCVLGNIESRNESATQLLRPCALRGRESTQDGFWTQRHQRRLFADLGDLIGGGLNA